MSKKHKNNPGRGQSNDSGERSVGPRFELEDNAEELFRAAIEKMSPDAAKHHKQSAAERAGGGATGASRPSKDRASRSVDLHRMTVDQARREVRAVIAQIISGGSGEPTNLRVVTGKGLHSGPGGGVLGREIHDFVRREFAEFIMSMTDAPSDVAVGGVPIRGHFDVVIKGRRT